MTSDEIGIKFREIIRGKNFMTPQIIEYKKINDFIIEISTGSKFLDTEMYGVTVIKGTTIRNDLSKCVHSLKEVEEYLEELKLIE